MAVNRMGWNGSAPPAAPVTEAAASFSSLMVPISLKQAKNAAMMQELAPELRKITEKYKGDMEKRARAQQELFRKHNYNPMGGCLMMFIQLPIFIGLYRALMVDVELRDAPLEDCCAWANACGAIVVSRHGCSPAMATWDELQAFLHGGERPFRLREDAALEHLHWATTRASVSTVLPGA